MNQMTKKEIAISNTVAKAVRMEYDSKSGTAYIVFEIIDEQFKQKLKKEWEHDIPLVIIGSDLKEV
jgi:hypothetical protein